MVWSDEQAARLKQLRVTDGLTYGVIAERMGMTRSQVISKAMRLGLRHSLAKAQSRVDRRARSEVTRRAKRCAVTVPKVSVPDAADENAGTPVPPNDPPRARAGAVALTPPVAPDPRGISLLDLERHHCRWPSSDAPVMFCGASRDEGSSYCAVHRAVATRRVPNRAGY